MAMLGRFGEWRLLSAVVATSFVSGTIFGVMPMIVGALMDEFAISHSLAALAITVEIGAAGIAIVLVSGFAGIMRRLPVALWAVGAFVLFGIVSMITDTYWVLLGARAMVGFATGIVTVINGASEASSREPDRLLSLTMIVGMSAMALLLRILPELTPLYGIDAVYGAMVLLAQANDLIAIFVALWYILNKTAWGRHVYMIGDDKEAAELAGIRTDRTLRQVYMLAGFICALAAWASIGRVGSISPQSFYEGNLESITAVVIGGISLFGGRGSILGALFGALIVGVFQSGLRLAQVDVLWQVFAIGWLIIIAVAIDQWIRKVSA